METKDAVTRMAEIKDQQIAEMLIAVYEVGTDEY